MEKHRFDPVSGEKRGALAFALACLPARVERRIVGVSGWLTNWGRSLVRPSVFLLAVVILFAAIYCALGHGSPARGVASAIAGLVVEAINVTLLAGYTAYFDASAPLADRVAWIVNLGLGLFWYSLMIPVLARRILR